MRIICGEASIYTHFEDFVVADLISAYKLGSFYFCDAENGKILQSYTRSGDLLAVDLTNAYKFERISSYWNWIVRRSEGVLRRSARLRIISFFLELIVRRFTKRLRRISSLRIKWRASPSPTSHFIRNPVEMRFRIAGLRIILFLLQLIIRRSLKRHSAESHFSV